MSNDTPPVEITLRIPGNWAHPGELIERLPSGFQISPEGMVFPDGQRVEMVPMAPDRQFAQIFESSCRRPATREELARVQNYSVNIGLIGPGGSLDAARTMMEAAAVIIQAGGAGVFIDNCGLAHGGQQWLEYLEDSSPDALSFAFVSIVRGEQVAYTIGMHALGLPEIRMRQVDIESNSNLIIDVLRYICQSDRPVDEGHALILEGGQMFHVVSKSNPDFGEGTPMYNPYGSLKLLPAKEIAERN
ncbi:MAG: DUF4261 domain-containing protein [Planctomycetota bacterium]|nr:MAG: DUF4261 domain-containing protein [Planctomycetota bacterium]